MTADREFLHSRVIDAPPRDVFNAFSDPLLLAAWWGPYGFTSTFEEFDFRPGGHWRFVMHGPDGTRYPNHNRFREIVSGERVVIEHLADDHHFVLTVSLEPEGAGKTRVHWRQVFDTVEHRNAITPVVAQANEQGLDRLGAASLLAAP